MNRIYFLLSMLLLITTSVQAQQNPLIGTWQLNLPSTIEQMDPVTKQKFDSLDQSVKNRMETSMGGRLFSFVANGTIVVNWQAQGNARTSSGTWQVNGEMLFITIDGQVQQYTYDISANQYLILRNTITVGFFSNLYLTWQP